METDLLAEKMRQAAEVLEKLAAMGVTSVNIESIKETPPASSADPNVPDKGEKTSDTKQGTPAQDGQKSIESTITGTRITFKMPKPKEEKEEKWQKKCTIVFVIFFVLFLFFIGYIIHKRVCFTNPTPGSHSFRQTLTTSLETHEVRVPEGK